MLTVVAGVAREVLARTGTGDDSYVCDYGFASCGGKARGHDPQALPDMSEACSPIEPAHGEGEPRDEIQSTRLW